MPSFSENFDGNHIFGKFLPKSWFFDNIDENQGSSKLLNEIEIFENFDKNQEFYEFWLKSRFSKILTKIEIVYENFWQNSMIWKIWPESRLFADKSSIPRILTKIEIFKNFD